MGFMAPQIDKYPKLRTRTAEELFSTILGTKPDNKEQ